MAWRSEFKLHNPWSGAKQQQARNFRFGGEKSGPSSLAPSVSPPWAAFPMLLGPRLRQALCFNQSGGTPRGSFSVAPSSFPTFRAWAGHNHCAPHHTSSFWFSAGPAAPESACSVPSWRTSHHGVMVSQVWAQIPQAPQVWVCPSQAWEKWTRSRSELPSIWKWVKSLSNSTERDMSKYPT